MRFHAAACTFAVLVMTPSRSNRKATMPAGTRSTKRLRGPFIDVIYPSSRRGPRLGRRGSCEGRRGTLLPTVQPLRGEIVLKDFKAFILRGNVIDLAIAVAIGAAFT